MCVCDFNRDQIDIYSSAKNSKWLFSPLAKGVGQLAFTLKVFSYDCKLSKIEQIKLQYRIDKIVSKNVFSSYPTFR